MLFHLKQVVKKKPICDAAYSKQSQDHVSGLLCTGISAQEYYLLDNPDSIVSSVIKELDEYFNGLTSQNNLGSHTYKDWGQHIFTQGTWTSDFEKSSKKLNDSLDDKVYFAGETYNTHGITPNRGFYIIRGSVQSAILSGYEVVDQILE